MNIYVINPFETFWIINIYTKRYAGLKNCLYTKKYLTKATKILKITCFYYLLNCKLFVVF